MSAYRLLHPRPALVVVAKNGKVNAMTLAWHMPVEESKVAIAVDRENYTYELIEKSKEFTLNVLPVEMIDIVWKAGTMSGRYVDKIEKIGIELEDGVKIGTPHVKGCLGYLECKVLDEIKLEEHSIFIAEISHSWADERYFKDLWLEGAKIPMHVGKDVFATPSNYIKVRRRR